MNIEIFKGGSAPKYRIFKCGFPYPNYWHVHSDLIHSVHSEILLGYLIIASELYYKKIMCIRLGVAMNTPNGCNKRPDTKWPLQYTKSKFPPLCNYSPQEDGDLNHDLTVEALLSLLATKKSNDTVRQIFLFSVSLSTDYVADCHSQLLSHHWGRLRKETPVGSSGIQFWPLIEIFGVALSPQKI
jgi:hypothetical protein